MNSKRLNIRELRKAARMSLEELSAMIGLSRQALANYEKGVTEPSEETLNKIGKALGMTKEQMYKE